MPGTLISIYCFLVLLFGCSGKGPEIDPKKCVIWGPGLTPHKIILPARYFYIQAVDSNGKKFSTSPGAVFDVEIKGNSELGYRCRLWVNTLDRKDGTFIVRYKMYHICSDLEFHVKYKGQNIASSPFVVEGPVYPDDCYCPMVNFSEWVDQFGCKTEYEQINRDLENFSSVNFSSLRKTILNKFNNPASTSLCNYVVKGNEVYRKCYGQYVGFKMFMDSILLSLARKVHLPDLEFFVNLGDWPLVPIQGEQVLPIFSWCGSDDSYDIVMPTYDITEASLECMGRVMLDMLSVQGNIEKSWEDKIEKAFWRGRDSRRERLDLIDIARKNPDLFNVSLTNFFFFRNEEEKYGPKGDHVSFFKFFDYKYQLNIDGTVASYRFPYLLAGDALVLKQNSKYYEHFYKELKPWEHYIPLKRDLSDLVKKIHWAKENDEKAKAISLKGQQFARENLMPQDVVCYHAVLFKEWSGRLNSEVEILDGMEHVQQPLSTEPHKTCNCHGNLGIMKDGLKTKEEL